MMEGMEKKNTNQFQQNRNAGRVSPRVSPIVALLSIGIFGIGAGSYPATASDIAGEGVTVEISTLTRPAQTEDIFGVLNVAGAEMVFSDHADVTETVYTAADLLPAAGAALSEMTELPDVSAEEVFADSEYANLAIAQCNAYVNVRSGPGTDYEVVGKMYDGSVAEIQEEVEEADGLWFRVVSGSVDGYIKSDYFKYGEELIDIIDDYIQHYAVVQASILNVRCDADLEADRIGYLGSGERVKVVEDCGDWLQVEYSEDKTGYVAKEYTVIEDEYISAKSLAEEEAELAAKREQEQRAAHSETQVAENFTITVTPPAGNYATNSELRSQIINYAMQYVGNRYVMGGQSLIGGTDCSGFTCYVYRDFGYYLARTPSGQWNGNGRYVSLEEAQPGDIVCYGYGNGCSHVALYLGDGKVVHEANSRVGCIVSDIYWVSGFKGIKNVID